MTDSPIPAGPYTHSMFTISRTMCAVMVCLAPATLYGFAQFGLPAVFLFLVTVVAAVVFEMLCLALAGRPVLRFTTDGSALLSGWLVAMTLPPWAPWWIGVIGAGLAIVLGKHVFGGLGQNLFNPAMVSRAVLLIALPAQMTTWAVPLGLGAGPDLAAALAITFGGTPPADTVSSASILGEMQSLLDGGRDITALTGDPQVLWAQFTGGVPGSLGETSAALLLLGGICLVLLRIITPVIPLAVLGTLGGLAALAHLADPATHVPPLLHLATGSAVFCAFFIATDYVSAPVTPLGKLVYGIGIGALIFVIRTWGAFPEGVAFAVLLMNACVPLIDRVCRPRVFGRTRSGAPLPGKART